MIRKRKLLWVFSGFFLMILTALLFLSQRDFGGKTAEMVQQTITGSLGYELILEKPRGNPLTGFSAERLILRDGKATLATARSVNVEISLRSLLEGHPVISSLAVEGLKTDLPSLNRIFRSLKPDHDPQKLTIREIRLRESRVMTPSGSLQLESLGLKTHKGKIEIGLALNLTGTAIEATARLEGPLKALHITEASGRIGDAPFRLAGQLSPSPILDITADKVSMELLPRLFPMLNPDQFGGMISFQARMRHSSSAGLHLQGRMEVEEGMAGGFNFTETRSNWSFRRGRLLFSNLDGLINGSSVKGSLSMSFRGKEPILWTIHARGSGLHMETWKKRFSWLRSFEGQVRELALDLKGPSGELAGTVAIDRADVKLMGQTFGGLTGKIALTLPRKVELDLEGFWCTSPISVSGHVAPSENPRLFVDLKSRAFCLKDVRALNGWLDQLIPEGDMAGTLSVRGTRKDPTLEWNLRSDRIRLQGELVENLKLSGRTQANQLQIGQITGIWKGGEIEASGKLDGLTGNDNSRLSLQGTLKSLDLARLKASPSLQGKATGRWTLSGTPRGTRIGTELTVSEARWGDIRASRVELKASRQKQQILIEEIQASNLLGGTMRGKGKLELQSGKSVSFDIQGNLVNLDLNQFTGESTPDQTEAGGNLTGNFHLSGNGRAPRLAVKAVTKDLTLFGVNLDSGEGQLVWSPGKLVLEEWQIPLWGAVLTLEGNLLNIDETPSLDLKGDFRDLDLLLASQHFELPVKMSGLASGSLRLEGDLEDPVVTLEAGAPQFYLDGFKSSDARIKARGPLSEITIESFAAGVGDSELTGKGLLSLAAPWEFRFRISGEGLDLATLMDSANPGSRVAPVGQGRIDAEGTLRETGLSGEGLIEADSLRVWGLHFENLHIPFVLLEGYLTVEEGRGNLYGGDLETQWTMGLREEQWGGNLSVKKAALSRAIRDAFDPEGEVSGTADFRLHLSGAYGKAFLLNGTGALEVRDGQVQGFSSQKELVEILDFRSLSASFSIDGKTLYLLPGSRIAAPTGNSVYRYVSMDGSVVPGGAIDLSGYGDVNLQALNAFLGGLQGLFAAGEDSEEQMQQFLSGLLGGVTNARNFREVEFAVQGDWEKPRLTELKTVTVKNGGNVSPIPASPSDPEEKHSSDRISLKLEIPTGPGGDGETNGMGEQIKQQLLEQILREILGPEDDNETGSFTD